MSWIQVTFRGNTTDDSASGTDAVILVNAIEPMKEPVNDPEEFVGGYVRNYPGWRWSYAVTTAPASIDASDNTDFGRFQDYGNLKELSDVLFGKPYLWLYSVSGSSRVDEDDAAFWSTHGLPVAIQRPDELGVEQMGGGRYRASFTVTAAAITYS